MDVKLFLKLTCKVKEFQYGYSIQLIRPRVICEDGWNVSIQHSGVHYCSPRKHFLLEGYKTVELGFPSESEPELIEYAENPNDMENTVFSNVPIELIEKIVERHGGIVDVEDRYGGFFEDIKNAKY